MAKTQTMTETYNIEAIKQVLDQPKDQALSDLIDMFKHGNEMIREELEEKIRKEYESKYAQTGDLWTDI